MPLIKRQGAKGVCVTCDERPTVDDGPLCVECGPAAGGCPCRLGDEIDAVLVFPDAADQRRCVAYTTCCGREFSATLTEYR